MKKILVTGACGQIGSELVVHLGKEFGKENVIATDIQKPSSLVKLNSTFMYLNVLDVHMTAKTVVDYEIDTIFHMAAILSAKGEQDPQAAYDVNMQGLMNILETARRKGVDMVITPSSIAAFGPDAPKENTPNETALNPTTMYGVTKVAGEKLLQYYFLKYGLDTRSLRYPGIISSETAPRLICTCTPLAMNLIPALLKKIPRCPSCICRMLLKQSWTSPTPIPSS
jgi:nucleoside-diphosphate-sugar epimerase